MKSNVKSIKKLPDSEKEVIFYNKNGERCTKKEKVTDRFLIELNETSSVVLTKDQFKQYGIIANLPVENPTTTSTFGIQNATTVAKPNTTLSQVETN